MAGTQRKPASDLIGELASEGRYLGFFEAVLLLERALGDSDRAAVPAVGELGPPSAEAIRFRHDPRLVFHPSDISSIRVESTAGGPRAAITSTFLGLLGAVSPLASYFTEDALQSSEDGDSSLMAFYDIFHHRLLSLFYRAWKKHHLHAEARRVGEGAFVRRALAFTGRDDRGPSRAIPDHVRLRLAPLLAQRSRPARTLEIVASHLLPGERVRLERFIERRVAVPEDQRAQLGRNIILGTTFTIGHKVADRSSCVRLVVGPTTFGTFERLIRGGRDHQWLVDAIAEVTRPDVDVELELQLLASETPQMQLGGGRGARLGVTSQLRAADPRGIRVRMLLGSDEPSTVGRIDDCAPPVALDPAVLDTIEPLCRAKTDEVVAAAIPSVLYTGDTIADAGLVLVTEGRVELGDVKLAAGDVAFAPSGSSLVSAVDSAAILRWPESVARNLFHASAFRAPPSSR